MKQTAPKFTTSHEDFLRTHKQCERDTFARYALAGLAGGWTGSAAVLARECYEIADAMIRERDNWND